MWFFAPRGTPKKITWPWCTTWFQGSHVIKLYHVVHWKQSRDFFVPRVHEKSRDKMWSCDKFLGNHVIFLYHVVPVWPRGVMWPTWFCSVLIGRGEELADWSDFPALWLVGFITWLKILQSRPVFRRACGKPAWWVVGREFALTRELSPMRAWPNDCRCRGQSVKSITRSKPHVMYHVVHVHHVVPRGTKESRD